ncbi:uncharacterized protein I303_100417 [Kwoniella dejecticola CBS 10117]|uniref:Uncharacterized protein n=1 Tax=Kwoniella dejecticola CBS 10117 TaxID=1296121 RepID=A0A1A6AEV1_9TREE|nr:uncharacterized protein I303_00417 [Kwoniella dejecticola CBS 10117]OBR88600.1 hypothetical protein I303_00417 [Kwoniella dejecticola CBS 10117]
MVPRRPDGSIVGSAQAGSQGVKTVATDSAKTIRVQSKKDKAKTNGSKEPQEPVDRAGLSKEVVKAVLASPLTVPWPNLPKHLQNATLHALKEMIPSEIADYHVSRARCHQREKRAKRRHTRKADDANAAKNLTAKGPTDVTGDATDKQDTNEVAKAGVKRSSSTAQEAPMPKKPRVEEREAQTQLPEYERPGRPEILSHMVLGINEVLKSLETQISTLRMRLMIMGDALNGKKTYLQRKEKSDLLPTAPLSPSSSPEPEEAKPLATRIEDRAMEYIVVPLLSINPQSLVTPIPQYCATYNALVYQYQNLSKVCRSRLKADEADDLLGEEGVEEVRVVPLGAVEKEIAELVGLRRVACLGLKSSHPAISTIRNLLPKSVLHPPRHSITLPIPTSSLTINNSVSLAEKAAAGKHRRPLAGVHYAQLHIKGIKTKTPVDNAARKAKRLEEVRKKRVEAKLKKKEAREKAKKRLS